MENIETNRTDLIGTILSLPKYNHKSYGETFYCFILGIERKSGYRDEIQIMVSERLIWNMTLDVDKRASVIGQIRTYNEIVEGKNRLNIVVFARELFLLEEGEFQEDENNVFLEGFICKPPIRRVSPLGREICDMMLAVNRMYNKSDYIPCIAWGRNAGYSENLGVGTRIRISGRIQSREYRKKDEEGNVTTKVAYEVSIIKIEE
ncbi:MAG: single-stranded DNA-binding protein [Eubacteriales bacterium]|nr:single-stranded DNA-binding protein [Eubacteriales bacterium]